MNRRLFFLTTLALYLLPFSVLGQTMEQADSLFSHGEEFDNAGNHTEAEQFYGDAYRMYQELGDTSKWMEAGKEYASSMVYRSKNEEAMELYEELLAVDHPSNDAYNRGDLYNSMGWSSWRTGNLDEALEYYQQSLPLAEESEDSLLIGIIYDNMGSVFLEKGNHARALEHTESSLPYFEGLGNKNSTAIVLGNIGRIYEEMGLYDQSLEYMQQSLELRQEIGNVNMLSSIYSGIGRLQRIAGNYSQALVAYEQALEYTRDSGDVQQQGTIYNNLGVVYKRLRDFEKAGEYYEESLAVAEKHSGPSSIATTSRNLANVYWESGEHDQAQKLYNRALELRRDVGNPYDIATSLKDIADIAIWDKDLARARQIVEELQVIADTTENRQISRDALLYRGDLALIEENPEIAVMHFKEAHRLSEGRSLSAQIVPLQRLAESFHVMGSDSALVYGRQAIDLIEEGRINAGAVSELKAGYFEKYVDFYITLANWYLVYEDNINEAYELVESAKARSLTDELNEAAAEVDQQLPEEEQLARLQRLEEIDSLYTELEMASEDQRSQLRQELRTAELSYQAYENQLRNEYPEYKNLQQPSPVSLDEAQKIIGRDTGILEYAVTDDQLIAFFITRDDVRVHRQKLALATDTTRTDSELSERVQQFTDAILSNGNRSELEYYSEDLYSMLLAPFKEQLKETDRLLIVPDGPLAYLPFEALTVEDDYLIERHTIKYMPSITSLTLLRERENDQSRDLLAVAGSEFSEETLPEGRRQGSITTLPSTITEVDSISTHFENVTKLKDDEITESKLKEHLNDQYRYIHLATHGIIDENNPHQSGLLLKTESELSATSKEDGLLKSSEIYRLNLDSDMVVLSACNTGLGKHVDGEGMLGLQRSFFYAGTSSVVVSLWSVYDRSSAYMMDEFYKSMLDGERAEESWSDAFWRWIGWDESMPFGEKATALREAKLNMIDHPLFNHPVNWAPFILIGR